MSRTRWAIGMVFGLALASSAQNTNSTWTFNGSDFWTTPGRWTNNNIASGVDATGNFATIDISDHRVVTLTNRITIGHMLFADVGGGGSHYWRLTNNIVDYGGGNIVTGSLLLSVSAGVPTIWVTNQSLHLGARLDGTQGFRKYGPGNLVLWNTNSIITGTVQIEGGLHQLFGEGAYGPTPGTFTPNAVVYSNLTVQNNDSYLVFSTNRGITLLAGGIGVWFRVGWGKSQTNHSAITGAGRLGVTYDGGHVLLASQSNDYTGGTWVGGGGGWWDNAASVARLRLGNHEVIPHGAGRGDLVISNHVNPVANKWTAWLEMNGFDETVNGLWGNGFISNNVATPATLTVGAADASGVFYGTIDDGPNGAISIVKTGRGLQFLAGTNRFDGSVTVQNGLLGIGGAGQIGGDLNLHQFATLSVGMTNLAQTLTVLGTTRATNATLILNLSGSTTPGSGVNDLLNLQGLEVVGANRIVVSPVAPLATGTPYTVVQYWTISGAGTVSADAPGTRYTVAVDTLVPGEVRLVVSGAASNLIWAGVNRRWNLTNSASWAGGSTVERFYTMDSVTFDDSQRGGFVGIEEGVRASSVVVDGSRSYTWVGYGGLDGSADLVKRNSGVLMLQNTNNWVGAVRVENGTLVTMNQRTLGTDNTRIFVTNNATWDIRGMSNQFRVVTVSGQGVGGQGAIVNNGSQNMSAFRFLEIAGDVTFGGYNRWDVRNTAGTGFVSTLNSPFSVTKVGPSQVGFVAVWVDTNLADIVIKEGLFALEGVSAAGDPSRYLVAHSNATFQIWGSQPLNKQFVFLGGSRLYTGSGSEANNHLQNSVVLTNGIVLADVTSGNNWNFSAPVSGEGGLLTINSGIVRFNAAINSLGPLIAQAGTLVVQSNAVVDGPSALVVRGSGRILVDDGRVNLADRIEDSTPVVLAGPGTFNLRGATNTLSTETVGDLVLLGGPATLSMENGTGSANLTLTFSGLSRQQGSVSLQHTGAGTLGHVDGQSGSRVFVTGLADGFVPWATWYGTNFMTYTSARGLTSMVPPTVEFDGTSDQSGQHVKFTAGNTTFQLDDDRSVESLTITPSGATQQLDVFGSTLTIAQGGVLQNGNTVFHIVDTTTGGQIVGGGGSLLFNIANAAATMRVSAVIGGAEFSKEGAGTMMLLADAATTTRTRIGGGILQLGNNSAAGMVGPGDVINYGTLFFHRSDNLTFTNPIVGGGNVWKTNVNTITFTAPNTYTGFTLIGSGRVVVDRISDEADSNLGVARPERPVDSYLQIMDGELVVNGSGTSRTIRTVYLDRGGGMTVAVENANGVVRFEGQVVGSGSTWFVKRGPGTLVLGGSSADNSNLQLLVATGHVDLAKEKFAIYRAVNNLALSNNATARIIGDTGDQIYGGVWLWTNAVLDLNGRDETINTLQGANGRVINNAAGTTSIFTVGRANGSGHFGGTIDDGAGVVALHKTGTGELRLTNDLSTYSGGTVISNGTLFVIADGALGALPGSKQSDNVVAYGGKLMNQDSHTVLHANRGIMVLGTNLNLQAGWNKTLTVLGDISGPGSVTIAADSGVVLLGGTNTFGGNLVQPSQTSRMRLLSSEAIPYGPGRGGLVTRTYLDLNGTSPRANWIEGSQWARIVNSNPSPATLTIGENNENTLYWSGLLNDAGGPLALRKVGSGIAALQAVGTNTMSGGVTVEGGVLALDSAPASTIAVASNAEARLVGRFGPVTVAAGGTVSLGATITNSPVTITSGVVRLTAAGLQEGRLTTSFETNSPNPATAVRLGTSYAHTRESQLLFPDNSTYVYSGFLYVPGDRPVTWTFAKMFDDNVRFQLDGTNWIVHTTWNVLATTNVTLTPGYHEFELRLGQGGGGVGPAASNFVWGFSVDREGRGMLSPDYYLPLVDMGDGLTFVVSTSSFGVANSFTTLGDTTFDLASVAKPIVTGAVNVGGNVTFAGAPGRSADFLGQMTLNVSPTLSVTSGVSVTVKGDVVEGFAGAALTKAGAGVLRLEGNALWAGDTTVAAGTLQLAGGAPASPVIQINAGATLDVTGMPGGTLTLGAGQTLKGNGTLAGGLIVDNGSTLSPGLSPGVLTVTGNLDFDSGGTFAVELLGTLAGQWDQVLMQAGSTLTPGGGTLSVTAPNPLTLGFVFPVISGWSTIDSSTFAGLPDGATFTAGANQFQINYGTLTGYENDVTLTVIPEPSTLGLVGMIAAAVLLRRRLR